MQAINIAGPIAGGFAVSLLTKDDIKGWCAVLLHAVPSLDVAGRQFALPTTQ